MVEPSLKARLERMTYDREVELSTWARALMIAELEKWEKAQRASE